jgi:hypothetical protein
MKNTSRTLAAAALLCLGLGAFSGVAQTQIYIYSGPISGFTDVNLTPNGLGIGGFEADFRTINETLYYNPLAQTLQEVGTVTLSPSSQSINISSSGFQNVGSGSATLTVGTGGSFSFNTTFTSVGSSSDPIANLLVPVSASGSFNGHAFSGSWDLDLPLVLTSFSASPTSLTFSEAQFPNPYPGQSGAQQGQTVLTVPGTSVNLADGESDGTFDYEWQQDPVAEAVAPVPDNENTMAMLAFGLFALVFFRRRRPA